MNIQVYIYLYLYLYINIHGTSAFPSTNFHLVLLQSAAFLHVWMYMYECTHISTPTWICISMYLYIYISMTIYGTSAVLSNSLELLCSISAVFIHICIYMYKWTHTNINMYIHVYRSIALNIYMAPLLSPPRAASSFCCEVPPSSMYACTYINEHTNQHQYKYTCLYIYISITI